MAKKNQSNNNEKPHKGGDRKKNNDDGMMTVVVLKIDLHCEGCAGKVIKAVRSLNGVESVKKGDNELNKIRVIGKVDPAELRQQVEEKTNKKVELISPAATKKQNDAAAGNGEQHKEHKQQIATVKDKNKTKKFPVTTTVFKVSLDCQGCIDNIQKLVRKTEGFIDMSMDKKKDLVTVKGGIDADKLMAALKDKLKKKVEIVQAKDGGSDGGKKGKDGQGDGKGSGGGKKGKGGEGDGKESAEDRQMEHHQYFVNQSQYIYPQYVPEYPYGYMHAPSMFSDENPNAACVIM